MLQYITNKSITLYEDRIYNLLTICSLSYLFTPVILFLAGWLRAPYCIILPIIAVVVLLFVLRDNSQFLVKSNDTVINVNVISFCIVFLIVSIWCLLSGTGGLGFSQGDLLYFESVLKDLCFQRWPMILRIPPESPAYPLVPEKTLHFVYYIGFWLPAGFLGKITHNYTIACWVLVVWGYVGTLLAVGWFLMLLRCKNSFVYLLAAIGIFMFFRTNSFLFTKLYQSFYCLFHWGNSTTLRYGSPHHAMAAWIASGMLFASYKRRISFASVSTCLSACIIITPIALVGVFFMWCALVIKWKNDLLQCMKKTISIHLLLLLTIVIPSSLYIFSNSFSFPFNSVFSNSNFSFKLYLYGLFVSIGIPLFLLLWKENKSLIIDRFWFSIIVFSLFFTTLFNMGVCNDFAIQTSKCPLYVLLILIADKLYLSSFKSVPGIGIVFLTSIAFLTYCRFCYVNRSNCSIPPTMNTPGIILYADPIGVTQTYGKATSFFFTYLADVHHSE